MIPLILYPLMMIKKNRLCNNNSILRAQWINNYSRILFHFNRNQLLHKSKLGQGNSFWKILIIQKNNFSNYSSNSRQIRITLNKIHFPNNSNNRLPFRQIQMINNHSHWNKKDLKWNRNLKCSKTKFRV